MKKHADAPERKNPRSRCGHSRGAFKVASPGPIAAVWKAKSIWKPKRPRVICSGGRLAVRYFATVSISGTSSIAKLISAMPRITVMLGAGTGSGVVTRLRLRRKDR